MYKAIAIIINNKDNNCLFSFCIMLFQQHVLRVMTRLIICACMFNFHIYKRTNNL